MALSIKTSDKNISDINDNLLPGNVTALTDADSGKIFIPTIVKNGVGIDKNTLIACNFEGTNGATTDNTDDPGKYAITLEDVSQISTAQFKTGSSSAFIDGIDANNPRIKIVGLSPSPRFSSNIITIDCWLRPDDLTDDGVGLAFTLTGPLPDFLDIVADFASGGFIIYTNLGIGGGGENKWTVPHAWVIDTWVHYRMVMVGNTVTFSIDGVSKTVTAVVTSNPAIIAAGIKLLSIELGVDSDVPAVDNYQGYMDGFKISDIALPLTFTPQTSLFEHETFTTTFLPKAGFIYDNASDQINKPLQTSFFAHLITTQTNVTGNAELFTIPYDSEIFDIGGDFNTSTGIFTAPITGKYAFSCLVSVQDVDQSGGTHINITVKLITTIRTYILESIEPSNIHLGGGIQQSYGKDMVEMVSGDTAKITLEVVGGGTVIDVTAGGAAQPNNSFSGHLVL